MNAPKVCGKTTGTKTKHVKKAENGEDSFRARWRTTFRLELTFVRVCCPTKPLSIDFCQNPFTGTLGIGGSSHLTTDHQVVGPVLYRLLRCRNPLLVSGTFTWGADARSDQNHLRTGEFTNTSNFQRRTNNAIHPTIDGLPDAQLNKFGDGGTIA